MFVFCILYFLFSIISLSLGSSHLLCGPLLGCSVQDPTLGCVQPRPTMARRSKLNHDPGGLVSMLSIECALCPYVSHKISTCLIALSSLDESLDDGA